MSKSHESTFFHGFFFFMSFHVFLVVIVIVHYPTFVIIYKTSVIHYLRFM